MSGAPASRRIVASAAVIESCETRSSSTIMPSPPCSRMALASADALVSLRVVSTVKKPSLANFCAIAPPTPQRTPTANSLSSTVCPYANKVLRPSDCHLEVAPITTATCLPFVFVLRFSLIREVPFVRSVRANGRARRADEQSVIRRLHWRNGLLFSALRALLQGLVKPLDRETCHTIELVTLRCEFAEMAHALDQLDLDLPVTGVPECLLHPEGVVHRRNHVEGALNEEHRLANAVRVRQSAKHCIALWPLFRGASHPLDHLLVA